MKQRKFWGWGYEDQILTPAEDEAIASRILRHLGATAVLPIPEADHIALVEPRISPPPALESIVTDDHLERLNHSYGKSFPDLARAMLGQFRNPPDLIAYPESRADVSRILDWANGNSIAIIPYGGGSSVCGGVETDVGDGYAGVLSMDMKRMNKFIEIDLKSRAAHIQAGILGPDLENQLKTKNLTLRHFP